MKAMGSCRVILPAAISELPKRSLCFVVKLVGLVVSIYPRSWLLVLSVCVVSHFTQKLGGSEHGPALRCVGGQSSACAAVLGTQLMLDGHSARERLVSFLGYPFGSV